MADTPQVSPAADAEPIESATDVVTPIPKKTPDGAPKKDAVEDKSDIDYQAEYNRLIAEETRLKKLADDVIAQRNTEKSKRQELQREREAEREAAEKAAAERDEAAGNVEAVKKRYETKEQELKDQLASRDRLLEKHVKYGEVARLAGPLVHDIDDFYKTIRDDITFMHDAKEDKFVWEIASGWELEEYITHILDKKPHHKRSTRAAGVGDPAPEPNQQRQQTKATTPDQLRKQTDLGKQQFANDPEAARAFLRNSLKDVMPTK